MEELEDKVWVPAEKRTQKMVKWTPFTNGIWDLYFALVTAAYIAWRGFQFLNRF